jgi:3-isopropylmalate/(R)-2-methylmalate dehydratase small subunit
VSAPAIGLETTFPLDHATQQRFLEGLDDIGITLRYADDISAFERNRPEWLPTALSS